MYTSQTMTETKTNIKETSKETPGINPNIQEEDLEVVSQKLNKSQIYRKT